MDLYVFFVLNETDCFLKKISEYISESDSDSNNEVSIYDSEPEIIERIICNSNLLFCSGFYNTYNNSEINIQLYESYLIFYTDSYKNIIFNKKFNLDTLIEWLKYKQISYMVSDSTLEVIDFDDSDLITALCIFGL
jgi:hypothetical protein